MPIVGMSGTGADNNANAIKLPYTPIALTNA